MALFSNPFSFSPCNTYTAAGIIATPPPSHYGLSLSWPGQGQGLSRPRPRLPASSFSFSFSATPSARSSSRSRSPLSLSPFFSGKSPSPPPPPHSLSLRPRLCVFVTPDNGNHIADHQTQDQNQNDNEKDPWPCIGIWLRNLRLSLMALFFFLRAQAELLLLLLPKPPIPIPWITKSISFPFPPKPLLVLLFTSTLLLLSSSSIKLKHKHIDVPYSHLVHSLQLGRVASLDFHEGSRFISFQFHSTLIPSNHQHQHRHYATASTPITYRTRKIDRDEKFLLQLLRDNRVTYRSVPPPVSRLLLSCIGTIAGLWIGVVPLIWILERRLHGSGTRKKIRTGTKQMVTFDDVQGVDSAKEELIEVVNCLQGIFDYKKLGAKLPTGILLVGPPGTGKTLLARAIAGEAGVPFFSVSASEFVELYVGRGAARVRELFKEARGEAPAVVFIDELDAVGTERDGFSVERDQTLNQLLTEMDGFDSDKQVVVLAATNRPAALDPALLRPGRFSRKVYVGEPNLEGRKKILAVHLRGVPLEEGMEVVCDLVASLTEGFVGADLANIANEAALLAVRRGGSLVTREDIMEAIEREKFGINDNQANAVTGSGSLVKLFPWLPSLAEGSVRNKYRNRSANGSRRVLSY